MLIIAFFFCKNFNSISYKFTAKKYDDIVKKFESVQN